MMKNFCARCVPSSSLRRPHRWAMLGMVKQTKRARNKVAITSNDHPVAELRPLPVEGQPRFGSCNGGLEILAEDDAHLKDFAERFSDSVYRSQPYGSAYDAAFSSS